MPLINYKHLLTPKQKRDLLDSIQNSRDMVIKPTPQQIGSGLSSILASIGKPLVLDMIRGKGAPRMGRTSSKKMVMELQD